MMQRFGATILAFGVALAWSDVAKAGATTTFMIDGKTVTSAPIDRFGDVSIKFTSTTPFATLWASDWGKLQHGLIVVANSYPKGTAPAYGETTNWPNQFIGEIAGNGTFGTQTSVTTKVIDSGINLALFEATTAEDVAFAVHYDKLVATGKMIYDADGKLTEERLWFVTGAPLGQALLKLEAPAAANAAPAFATKADAFMTSMNTTPLSGFQGHTTAAQYQIELEGEYNEGEAILQNAGDAEALIAAMTAKIERDEAGQSNGPPPAAFSKLSAPAGPVYNWNLIDGKQSLTALYLADMDLTIGTGDHPKVYHCKGIRLELQKAIGSGTWEGDMNGIDGHLKEKCTAS